MAKYEKCVNNAKWIDHDLRLDTIISLLEMQKEVTVTDSWGNVTRYRKKKEKDVSSPPSSPSGEKHKIRKVVNYHNSISPPVASIVILGEDEFVCQAFFNRPRANTIVFEEDDRTVTYTYLGVLEEEEEYEVTYSEKLKAKSEQEARIKAIQKLYRLDPDYAKLDVNYGSSLLIVKKINGQD